jgi:hypothetical protein
LSVPVRLIELWLTLVHGALCRQVAGGLLVRLPAGVEVVRSPGGESVRELAVLFAGTDRTRLEHEANQLFSKDWLLALVADDLKEPAPAETPHLSLRQALSELQSHLLDHVDQVPPQAELLAYFLKHAEYRSRHISVRRAIYHVVPHEGGWKVKRQGQEEGDTYAIKEEAVRAGADRARAHAAGQLIIHAADGTFQEERTYGKDPTESTG